MQDRDIPYFSFINAPELLKHEWVSVIEKVIRKGQFVGGEQVENFEMEFSMAIGADDAVSVGNGLDGLVIAMRALGIGKGSRVAVPAHTFIATWLAVDLVGAIPVGVDVDSQGLLNLEELFALNSNIDAVIPVHIHGAMVDMARLSNWAVKNKVIVIEDASQSHKAKLNERFAGTWGDAGVFSLYPSKNLGALGDGGIVIFRDSNLAEIAKTIRNYGSAKIDKYDHKLPGINSRLDALQAAVLRINLSYLDEWNAHRVRLGKLYLENLHSSVTVLQGPDIDSVRHHFPILVNNPKEFMAYLLSHKVGSERHYPTSAAEAYSKLHDLGKSNINVASMKISRMTVSLPISQWHSTNDVEMVCHIINKGIENREITI